MSNAWVNSETYSLKITKRPIDLVQKELQELNDLVSIKMLLLQGLISEIQMKSGQTSNFDAEVYDETNEAKNLVQNFHENIDKIMTKINHAKDLLDSALIAQELSDGFSEYQQRKNSKSDFFTGLATVNYVSKRSVAAIPKTILEENEDEL